jgi:hypothetical protein
VRLIGCNGAVAVETRLGDEIGAVQVTNPRFGTWTVDDGPNGYVQPHIREPAGGGSVVVPYVLVKPVGELFIGVLAVTRALVGGGRNAVREVPRGFIATAHDESHDNAAAREVQEETGIVAELTARLRELPGDPVNANTAFFATEPGLRDGVHLYALPFSPRELTFSDEDGRVTGRLLPHMVDGVREVHEKIRPSGLLFVPVLDAMMSSDGFTRSAVGTLLADLLRQGILSVTPAGSLNEPLPCPSARGV